MTVIQEVILARSSLNKVCM
uniref:Uncharacterized protein n=1 Tax=Anguilla anguilla TaxID=7936 RepID=A0A0E9VB89_ANGAN